MIDVRETVMCIIWFLRTELRDAFRNINSGEQNIRFA